MTIKDQFNLVAKEYDTNRKKFIPCFNEFYVNTTAFIAGNIQYPKNILDLGAGTGLLSYFWYQHFPKSKYTLVDIADEMINIAKHRFDGIENISYQITDYSKEFPIGKFDIIISALSIHHLGNKLKQELFSRIHHSLNDGGIFVNYDQFCVDFPNINHWFNSYWENQLKKSELTEQDIILWEERRKLDKECSLETELSMLKKSKFCEVNCVYSNQKFSVIAAIK